MTGRRKKPPRGISETIVVTDTLDLHGFFPQQIPEMIEAFINNAIDLGLHRLKIIHGKGKSRLKFEVYQVLKKNPHISHFHDAHPENGGWGSTIVELSK
jgi:DNA mismatch repair protein MutS2